MTVVPWNPSRQNFAVLRSVCDVAPSAVLVQSSAPSVSAVQCVRPSLAGERWIPVCRHYHFDKCFPRRVTRVLQQNDTCFHIRVGHHLSRTCRPEAFCRASFTADGTRNASRANLQIHITSKNTILISKPFSYLTQLLHTLVLSFVIFRNVSSGMLRRVALVRTDVSEEPIASFTRVTRISELGITQAETSNRHTLRRNTRVRRFLVAACVVPSSPIFVTLMKESPGSSKMSVLTRITRCNIPEDTILHSHHRENLKS
jgi:hypothetical protein